MTPEQQPISQPQRIDRYVGQYAERAVDMVASEIRALFAVAARPEIVSLAGGSPYVAALPLEAVGTMVGQLVTHQGAAALQYCTAQGDAGLRELDLFFLRIDLRGLRLDERLCNFDGLLRNELASDQIPGALEIARRLADL